jgi:thioredoxin 1
MEVLEVNDQNFETEVIKSDLPVVVDLWAEWCGPCRMVSPHIEALADEYEGKVKFVKLNVDSSPNTAARYGVMSIPTLLYFKSGEVQEQTIGALPKKNIAETVDKVISG